MGTSLSTSAAALPDNSTLSSAMDLSDKIETGMFAFYGLSNGLIPKQSYEKLAPKFVDDSQKVKMQRFIGVSVGALATLPAIGAGADAKTKKKLHVVRGLTHVGNAVLATTFTKDEYPAKLKAFNLGLMAAFAAINLKKGL